MKDFFNQQQCETIADALVDKGYIVLDINDKSIHTLSRHSHKLRDFTKASIGRHKHKQQMQTVRSDETSWLNEDDPIDRLYLDAMQTLQDEMNRMLFMGLAYHEAHYAHYENGAFYKKHLDAFVGKSSRKLTSVLYLNETWLAQDGGELLMYNQEGALLETILPTFGRMVLFLSDQFPHEVKPALKSRYSIAGWFRIDTKL
jgi:SM-20-related protein